MSAVGAGSPEIDAEVDIEAVEDETWVLHKTFLDINIIIY